METSNSTKVTVEIVVQAPLSKVWSYWTEPDHITKWYQPSEDWHAPRAENDLRAGGEFLTRMEAKDGSMGFDYSGIYDEVKPYETIGYTLGDGRKVDITFVDQGEATKVVEIFDPESMNPVEFQQAGWQAILNSFKRYTEAV
ncbi:polyketide cyclase [Paenibacillus pectinilyticus]|uniref:Polyketide cyclase n=1 Tax=Paenibacillus pectinilyticus TaxID=512399 RepID=A0A1C1A2E7_9BACL|nr:SRPBCC family protein [Paenibacillus pectinilyticus]OCT14702.1 polyketide cyclase [Paenibacillus pectinilyticus]